ncbi:hypothetical protein NYP18_08610 [Corynebacterium sp. YIM 101645]|uniref:Secreted protein n=1 Tax=Corynebacterium lemuris TaxID=1859292 RepID=A0ABT2G0K3_9CORY|nr:hypothetical protein [Corynebacterium lemuris]MCS5479719.1 hypothetical protein [Corynebacterium lemuris]
MRKFRNTMTAFAVAGLVATTPAIAHADIVDDYLAAIPAGQISCQQANNYWTNADDYQSKRSQALLGANFHPRGGEIRAAVSRVDEAAHRCGLVGGGGQNNQAPAPAAPAQQAPAPAQQAPAPAAPAVNTVTVAGQTVPVPEVLSPVVTWLRDVLGNLGIRI